MTKLLVSITSYNERERPLLEQVLSNYQTEFSDLHLQFVLSINYDFDIPPNAIALPKQYDHWHYTWNNKKYLADNYQHYQFIIEQDSDILITRENLDYYIATVANLSLDYIPGFLVYEQNPQGQKYLITMHSSLPRIAEKRVFNGKEFLIPYNLHACMFICDRARYGLALNAGLSIEPTTIHPYTSAEWSRSDIYSIFKKVVSVDDIKNGNALVHHLSNKYWSSPFMKYSSFAKPKEVSV